MAMTKRTVTTGDLIDRIRNLGEIRATYVTDSVLVAEINQSRLNLYEKLVDVGACDYFESNANVNIVTNTASYDLPDRYHTTLGVDVLLSNGDYSTLETYSFNERNFYSDSLSYDREDTRYRIRGDFINFYPTPDWTQTGGVRHYYVASPTDFDTTLTNETMDGFWGWEDFIVYDCLVKFIGGKEEGDATQWEKERSAIEQRIERMKDKRNRGGVDSVVNVDWDYRRRKHWGKTVT